MDATDNGDELFHFHGMSFLIPENVMTVIRKKTDKLEFEYALIGFEYIEERYLKDGRFDVASLNCVSEDVELFMALSMLAVSHGVKCWPMEDEMPDKSCVH